MTKKIITYLKDHQKEIINGVLVTVLGGVLLAFLLWIINFIILNFQRAITFLEKVPQNVQIFLANKIEISNDTIAGYLLLSLGIFLVMIINIRKNKSELEIAKLQINNANSEVIKLKHEIQTLKNKPLVENLAG